MNKVKLIASFGSAVLVAACSLTLARGADDKAKGKGGAADLVGSYTIVSGETSGVPEPEARVKGSLVRFSEDRVVVTDKGSKELFGASYELDTAKTPWRITMTSKLAPKEGEVAKGLIEKDGETLRLIYALPGGEEPKDFKTKEKQLMFVMKSRGK